MRRVAGGIYVCECDACKRNLQWWPPRNSKGTCDYCKLVTPHWVRKDSNVSNPPKEVLKFLKIKTICHFCFASIDGAVRVDLGMCWGEISKPALHLAILKVLNHQLIRAAHLDTWQKGIITTCMRTGETLPIWASEVSR